MLLFGASFAGPNDAKLCGACDNANGPFCGADTGCFVASQGAPGSCAHYCCEDGDCGSGKCIKLSADAEAGFCLSGSDATAKPVCDAPAKSPSGGSCVKVGG